MLFNTLDEYNLQTISLRDREKFFIEDILEPSVNGGRFVIIEYFQDIGLVYYDDFYVAVEQLKKITLKVMCKIIYHNGARGKLGCWGSLRDTENRMVDGINRARGKPKLDADEFCFLIYDNKKKISLGGSLLGGKGCIDGKIEYTNNDVAHWRIISKKEYLKFVDEYEKELKEKHMIESKDKTNYNFVELSDDELKSMSDIIIKDLNILDELMLSKDMAVDKDKMTVMDGNKIYTIDLEYMKFIKIEPATSDINFKK